MAGLSSIPPQPVCGSIKTRGIPLCFIEYVGPVLFSMWHRPCEGEVGVAALPSFELNPGRISMIRTVASMTAAAVLYAFTSALAQAPESAPTAPPAAPAPQATAPATAPTPSKEAPKGEGHKDKHGKKKKEHGERGKSGEHRKDGEHKGQGKHKDREKHGDKDKHEDGDKQEKN